MIENYKFLYKVYEFENINHNVIPYLFFWVRKEYIFNDGGNI